MEKQFQTNFTWWSYTRTVFLLENKLFFPNLFNSVVRLPGNAYRLEMVIQTSSLG